MPDALLATTLPIYPGVGQAPNMLACIPNGLVCIPSPLKMLHKLKMHTNVEVTTHTAAFFADSGATAIVHQSLC